MYSSLNVKTGTLVYFFSVTELDKPHTHVQKPAVHSVSGAAISMSSGDIDEGAGKGEFPPPLPQCLLSDEKNMAAKV